jgi:serine/threonine-protein kinase
VPVTEVSEPAAGMMVTSNVRLVHPLGEGGMGRVWMAEHLSLRTNVVVKFMSRDLANSPEAIARFSREAAAASQVKSPHVVQMLDHGVGETGAPYIVMELLEGKDLEHHLRASGVLAPREVVGLVAQLARALSKAHERGIVHRDIKPSNVFLLDAGGGELFVKLLDFGIAKGPEPGVGVGLIASTTRTGAFMGSPYYMSPEQVVGAKTIDFRTDLWSLGVVVYEALTGTKPFYADNVGALALRIHRDPLPVPTRANRALPSEIDGWFARACAREPTARFASAKDMAEALAVALTGESIPPGLRIEGAQSPRSGSGLASEAISSNSATIPVGADARSETGAGAPLVTTGLAVPMQRGGWRTTGRMLAGIALAAVAVGFVVPKLMKASKPPAIEAFSSAPAAAIAAPLPSQREPATSPPPATSTPPEPPALAAPSTSSSAPAPSARPLAPNPGPSAQVRAAKPHAPVASSSATPPPPPAAPPVKVAASATAARGSDDDIK